MSVFVAAFCAILRAMQKVRSFFPDAAQHVAAADNGTSAPLSSVSTPNGANGAADMAARANPLALDRQLCFQFYAASNLINRLYTPVLAELGLTYPQYLVMLVLWEDDGVSVGILGRKLHLDSGTVTPLLKRMEVLGLLERARDRVDERRVLVRLTQAGHLLRERAMHVPETMACGQDLDQLDALRETVGGLVDVLAAAQPHRR